MKKTELKALLKKGDEAIAAIREQQMVLVANHIYEIYKIEKGDKLIIKGFTVVVVGFEIDGTGYSIKLRYKRIKYNGCVDNVVFTSPIVYKLENLGKYNGRY